MPRGLPRIVKSCLEKARESALLAVEIYNKPAVSFRTGGYLSLIVIAWISVFHAIFFQRKVKPYFRKKGSRFYERVGDDYKHWDLKECLSQYYKGTSCPERENLEFIRQLRDKVEHRAMTDIDPEVFGECQACILNFEDLIVREFGEKYSINPYLTFPLRISRQAPPQILRPSSQAKEVLGFIRQFRASLSTDIGTDQRYCFQVYLVPKIGNHPSQGTAAVEFIHYDPTKPEEMSQYERVAALIKERQVPVRNLGRYRPTDVVKRMIELGFTDFTTPRHTWAWKYYGIRPAGGSAKPEKCKSDYCIYDAVHRDYVYTDKWVQFLKEKWADLEERKRVIGSRGGSSAFSAGDFDIE